MLLSGMAFACRLGSECGLIRCQPFFPSLPLSRQPSGEYWQRSMIVKMTVVRSGALKRKGIHRGLILARDSERKSIDETFVAMAGIGSAWAKFDGQRLRPGGK